MTSNILMSLSKVPEVLVLDSLLCREDTMYSYATRALAAYYDDKSNG